ncbi:hypothetical protein [Actinokineospora sp. UTMC 2448]|uniref:hypothetical protein n=1 Tax=Actinokineospora sp. UTMC 2448 TaxID=2268449 RepID=UPI002164EBA7|nr:hypothetical protein [Actinokineospora sp. UTMC 2448]UVS80591.1 hypothetical protein Actkin_04342 [Actinokineospora sp. UTMC 2448]
MPDTGQLHVRIYLNSAPDAFRGYRPQHEVVEVAAYLATRHDGVLDDAFHMFNVGDDPCFGPPDPRAVTYRLRGNRSLSVGDVIALDDEFHSCEPAGWRALTTPPLITDMHAPGITPLQPTPVARILESHPADHAGCHVFQVLTLRWCATLAHQLITADPLAAEFAQQLDITGLGRFLTLDGDDAPDVKVTVDDATAMATDLTKPVLSVPVVSMGECRGHIVIDGWHRIHHALVIGRTCLPAWMLTGEAAQTCSLPME